MLWQRHIAQKISDQDNSSLQWVIAVQVWEEQKMNDLLKSEKLKRSLSTSVKFPIRHVRTLKQFLKSFFFRNCMNLLSVSLSVHQTWKHFSLEFWKDQEWYFSTQTQISNRFLTWRSTDSSARTNIQIWQRFASTNRYTVTNKRSRLFNQWLWNGQISRLSTRYASTGNCTIGNKERVMAHKLWVTMSNLLGL